jgi:hypothetical protein
MPMNFPPSYYAPEYLQVHRRALKNIVYGSGNIIKAEVSSGRITYVMNSTGIRYSTAEEAFAAADISGLTGFQRITGGGPGQSGSMRGLAGFNERTRSIKASLRTDAELMRTFGIDNVNDLTFTVGSARIPQGAKETAKNVLKDVSEGRGFMFQTKDSGTFVRAFVKDVELTGSQLNELLYRTSGGAGGLFSNEEILESLKKGELGKLFMKAAKRGKGIFSLDGVSLAGNDLLSLAKNLDSTHATFGDSVKIFDTTSDLRKIALAHLEDQTLVGEDLVRAALGRQTAEEIADRVAPLSARELDEAAAFYGQPRTLQSALNSMDELGIISRNNAAIAGIVIDDPSVLEAIKDSRKVASLSPESLARYNELKNQFERPFDGSTLLNKNFINKMRSNMQAELAALEAKGLENLSPEEFEKRKFLKSDIDKSASGMDAETIRFNFMREGRTFNIKGVGSTAELDDRLSRYSTVTSLVNIKKELAVMGQTDMANIILQGKVGELVITDPLAPAFHGEIFSSQEAIDSTAQRGRRIVASYEEALRTGQFDDTLTRSIYASSQQSIETLPAEMRTTAGRSKRFATALVDALESGMDVRQIPQLSNYLLMHVQSQIGREKDGVLLPVMENTYRMSINTELGYYSGRKVGAGLDDSTLEDVTKVRLKSGADEIGLMNFKIRGHDMLMSGHAANIFHHSLGTFDLDDKGIPMMRTMDIFGEGGEKIGERIGFFTFRQPTGPGEYILSMAEFDTETIRATFGKNKSYVSALNEIVERGDASGIQKIIHRMVSPEEMTEMQINAMNTTLRSGANPNTIQAELNEAMIDVMNRSSSPAVKITQDIINDLDGLKYGSPLAMDRKRYDNLIKAGVSKEFLEPNYAQGNIFKLFAKSGDYGLEKSSIDEIINSSLFSSSEKQKIKNLANSGQGKKALQALAEMVQFGTPEEVAKRQLFMSNLVTQEFGLKQLRAVETADSLGLYINRLTLVTASTRQSDEILKHLDPADVLKLKENYKVGLIAPGSAIDFNINMNTGARINATDTISYYTEELNNSIVTSIRRASADGADLRGIENALAKLTGRFDKPAAAILLESGAESVFQQGRFVGALRALAYKQGIEDPDLLSSVDESVLRQRATMGDNAEYVRGIVAGYEELSSEIDPANELANKFIASLKDPGTTPDEINDTLVRTIGTRSGKYSGLTRSSEETAKNLAGARSTFQTFGVDRSKPFMSEAVVTSEGRQAANQVLNLQEKMSKELDAMFSGAINGTEDMSQLATFRRSIESQMMGQKVYESILDSANKTNSSIQEVIDSIDTISPMRRGLRDIGSLVTGEEDADELAKLVNGARDARAMAHYKRQSGLMDLADQYDAIKSSPKVDTELNVYNTMNTHRRMQGIDPVIDPAMEALNVDSGKRIQDLGLSDELFNQVRDMRRISRIRQNLTPELEGLLSKRGSAIDLAPTTLDDADRAAMLGDEAMDAAGGGVGGGDGTKYRRIGDSFRDGAMKKAFENPTIRKAGYAGLAIIAASFAYQHSKGRSPEDVSGPPLLPGGSAYEQMPQRSPQMPQTSMFSGYNQGTSYSVNLEGSSDQINSFRSAAGSVAPGSVNSTMYKGLPNLGSDPYSQVASSF